VNNSVSNLKSHLGRKHKQEIISFKSKLQENPNVILSYMKGNTVNLIYLIYLLNLFNLLDFF